MALSHPRPVHAALVTAVAAMALAPAAVAGADTAGLRVHEVQGTTRTSPYAGDTVAAVPGIVTAVNTFGSARGFWFQDPEGDDDPRTSEGLFVFTGGTSPDVRPGDEVEVTGTVQEYRAGGAETRNQSLTQLTRATWSTTGTGAEVPTAVRLGERTVPAALAPKHGGDISALDLRPDRYALDFWAAHESMVLSVRDAPVVGATDDFNALWTSTRPGRVPAKRGGTVYDSYRDANSGRLKIESLIPFAKRPFPVADVGDRLDGVTEGPLSYAQFGGYLLKATTLGEHRKGGLERETTRETSEWELSVATYNVENLSPADDAAKVTRLAEGIADGLRGPDIVALEEIQDNSGPEDDGTTAADATLDALVAAIEDAGGPAYHWREISPQDKADGGQPGGNIRNAFLFDPERTSFVDTPGGDATTPVRVEEGADGGAALSASPGRVAPADEAWTDSRKPLAGQFRFAGRDVFVVTNHFASKGGDDPLHGVRQPPVRSSETQRLAQAAQVRGFADDLAAVDPDANLVVAGDLNDFWFSDTLGTLTRKRGLHAPIERLPRAERYGYVFDGNAQSLDHILTSRALRTRVDYDIVHVNSEFNDQVSDHDPQVARFRPLSGDSRTDLAEQRRYYRTH